MEYAIEYMAGVIGFIGAMAIRTPDTEVRTAFILGLGWPLAIPLMLVVFLMDRINWDFDAGIDGQGRWFKVRRPVDGWKGLAVTFFRVEVRVWKRRG